MRPVVEAMLTEQILEPTPTSLEETVSASVRIAAGTMLSGADLHRTGWVQQQAAGAAAPAMAGHPKRIRQGFGDVKWGVKPAVLVEGVLGRGSERPSV